MSEPKYKLNRRDESRWQSLVKREALSTGGYISPLLPLTTAEQAELEMLQRKRRQRLHAHPRIRAAFKAQRRADSLRRLKTQAEMFQATLQNIADGPRNTLERRLARSTLEFHQALQHERNDRKRE